MSLGASVRSGEKILRLGGCVTPGHPRVTVPSPGNAAVTVARGSIKGASSCVPRAELAWHRPEDTREEGLEGPVGFPGG